MIRHEVSCVFHHVSCVFHDDSFMFHDVSCVFLLVFETIPAQILRAPMPQEGRLHRATALLVLPNQ